MLYLFVWRKICVEFAVSILYIVHRKINLHLKQLEILFW